MAYKTFYNWENRPIVTLIIWNDPKMFSKTLIDTELMTLKVFALSAVLILIFLYILSKLMVRPIEKLLSATNEIAKDNFEVKISDIKGPTEFEDLASSFNKMASELSEKRKVQEDFIATLAHDMKVPLIAEKKAIDLLINYEQYKLSEDQILLLKNMLASNNLLLELVNNLLLTYKIEAGMHKSSKNTHNIVRLIYETVTDLNLLAKEKNQELTFDYTEDSIWINMDQNDIKRVLINLISNAINYTDKNGKINVNISAELEKIIVIVKDNGYGIAEEEKPKLFKRFSRGTKKLKNIGTGLGLYLCNLIIQEHNGRIWFESEINKGSTFYFSLPRE